MEKKTGRGGSLQFGEFVLDRGAHRLLRGTEELHLSPKAFLLLAVLAEAWPNAVSKDELSETLWPDTFVEVSGLATVVAEVRAALGDDARTPRFIRTLHRHGYAFVPAVRREERQVAYRIRSGGRAVDVSWGEAIIGRSADAAVSIDDPSVSRAHARVTLTADEFFIEDLASKNGTFVNGTRVTERHPLQHGDVITVGDATLTLERAGGADSTQTAVHPPLR